MMEGMATDDGDAPRGGLDYPRNRGEFDRWFAEERSCRTYLERLRWPDGFVCPACRHTKAWMRGRGLRQCSNCSRETSVTSGTIFHRTRLPLSTWLAAVWHVTDRGGVSAHELMRLLDLGSYQTAWSMLHKLRRAMLHPEQDRLRGTVEVGETHVDAVATAGAGQDRTTIGIAVEVPEPGGFGRVRVSRLEEVSARSLVTFVGGSVERGSTIRTDGSEIHRDLTAAGFLHVPTSRTRAGGETTATPPHVRRIAHRLKRWLHTTYKGVVSTKHLDDYLDEFTFRCKVRPRGRGPRFYRLLKRAVETDPFPYDDLTGARET